MSKSTNPRKIGTSFPEWNFKKFEEKLEKEIKHRKNLMSYTNFNMDSNADLPKDSQNNLNKNDDGMILDSSGIYKQFFLIGVPPTVENSHDPNSRPTILIAYPPFEYPSMPIKKIIDHCMPTGHTRKFLSSNSLSPIQDEFVFQFGGGFGSDEKPIYGVCVHVSTKETSPPFYGCKKDKDRIFCFCLMTKMPVFSVHFSFLTSLALWTVGHVRNLRKPEKIRVNIPPGEPIDNLDLVDQIGHHPSITVPTSFQNEIALYFISHVTDKQDQISRASSTFMKGYTDEKLEKINTKHHHFKYTDEDCAIKIIFPPKKDIYEKSIEWCSMDTLFSLISVSDILTVLSGLLLDRQVLIIGSKLQEVSMTVWALQSILRPFVFAGTIIPILPTTSEDYLGLLQLPTPFLFGVPRCNELKNMSFLETAVFVDLDKENVPPIEDLPCFPNADFVEAELNKLLTAIKSNNEYSEFSFPRIYKKTLNHKYSFSPSSCEKINKVIASPFENTLYSNYICGFFVTDMSASPEGVTIFNEELFLGQIYSMLSISPTELYGESLPSPPNENDKDKDKKIKEEFEFWNNIVESQTFQVYIEKRMQDFIETKYRTLIGSNTENSKGENNINNEKKSGQDNQNSKQSNSIETSNSSSEKLTDKQNEDDTSKSKKKLSKKEKISGPPKSDDITKVINRSPPKVSPKIKRTQSKGAKRNKSLRNVLFDLPTPSSSKPNLLNNKDSEGEIEEDQNDSIMKLKKSSTAGSIKTDYYGDADDEDEKLKKKYFERQASMQSIKIFNDDDDDDEDIDNYYDSDSEDQKTNDSKLKRKNSLKKIDTIYDDDDGDSDSEKKQRRASANKIHTKTTKSKNPHKKLARSSYPDDLNDDSINHDTKPALKRSNSNRDDKEQKKQKKVSTNKDDNNDKTQRKSSFNDVKEKKPSRKSSITIDDNEVRRSRKSSSTKDDNETQKSRKSSSSKDDNETQKSRKSSSSKDDNENRKMRKSSSLKDDDEIPKQAKSTKEEANQPKDESKKAKRKKSSNGSNAEKSSKGKKKQNQFDSDEETKIKKDLSKKGMNSNPIKRKSKVVLDKTSLTRRQSTNSASISKQKQTNDSQLKKTPDRKASDYDSYSESSSIPGLFFKNEQFDESSSEDN